MDFNPLDLLASAAELQKKNDDGEQDVTMVTHQKSNTAGTNSKTFTAVVQKENKEIRTVNNNKNINNNNNNVNTIKGKSVIIRKIKVGVHSDLEKMLNEHNYGNAKKNSEGNIRVVFEDGGHKRTDNITDSAEETSPRTKGIHTIGKNGDKITIITVSNKDCGSHLGDVKCISKDINTSNTDTPPCNNSVTSSCPDTSQQDSAEESSKCAQLDSEDCPKASWSNELMSLENGLQNDFTTGHVEGHADGQSVISDIVKDMTDNDNNSDKIQDTSNTKLTVESQDTEKKDTLVISKCLDNKLDSVGCENENLTNSKEITSNSEASNLINIDSLNNKSPVSNVFVRDRKLNELDQIVSTSDLRKSPYINVSAKQASNKSQSETEPLVININSKSEKTPSSEMLDRVKQNMTKKDSKLISTLLSPKTLFERDGCIDKMEPKFMDMGNSKTIKLDIAICDKLNIVGQPETCDTLKSLELNESICGDVSVGSVHLLSPDRRNPDSVGIAESPVTYPPHDVTGVSDTENQPSETFGFFGEYLSGSGINENTNQDSLSDKNSEKQSTHSSEEKVSKSTDTIHGDSHIFSHESEKRDNKSANGSPIFRFDFDHSYAGLPGKINSSEMLREQDVLSQSGDTETGTPLGSTSGDLSQDSGYEDISQSPASESLPLNNSMDLNVTDTISNTQKLVPVLVSINDNGKLMLHNDPVLQKSVTGQVFTIPNNGSSKNVESGVKLISGTNLTPLSPPILLSPISKGAVVAPNADSVLGLLRPTTTDVNSSLKQISPPKFGKFRIGTFGSFSNTGMKLDDQPQLYFNKSTSQEKTSRTSGKRNHSTSSGSSGKSSPVVDTLGTLVQKVRSSLSPSSQIDTKTWNVDHIHHDHDYCMKNFMPSVVSSVLEAKLQKELSKNKQNASKSKKVESDLGKSDGKFGKRKRTSSNQGKEDLLFDGLLYDEDSNSQSEFIRPKTRAEKYIEQKSSEPKVKITGSSNFQDQFVYFMNTKKRSRRRESRDSPIPLSLDKLFIPPKPGDIIVPHLTDQDIENLKTRSKQKPGQSGINSLRSEFMASKLANIPFSGQGQPESADDERSIINTILSLENENLTEQSVEQTEQSYNESMEMYGQGLGSDIMSLTPEQMNLTQEQMDLLFSAVDEVQNSSPGLIGAEKLVSTDTGDSTFGQFPVVDSSLQAEAETGSNADSVEVQLSEQTSHTDKQPETGHQSEYEGDPMEVDTDATTETEGKSSDVSVDKQADDVEVPPATPMSTISADEETDSDTEVHDAHMDNNDTEVVQDKLSNNHQTAVQKSDMSSVSKPALAMSPPNLPEQVSADSTASSIGSMVLPANISVTSNNLNGDISLQTIDRGPIDLLGNDFRLDKSDLFIDNSTTSPLTNSGVTTSQQIPPDYSAPWIVTVSMYWNDLPAVMMENQPFVRLVDIHKQILPAKDTGILKKRCQLMGIPVENCSEMQRYFLVQYGKAYNSKSTLIVSKESANELIGYYVDPQPKSSRVEEHTGKSVIEHRREQLRRIALARRAELRARQNALKKEDPRAIKEPQTSNELDSVSSQHDPTKVEVEIPKVLSVTRPGTTQTLGSGIATQRSTRHKKINFLEMLRGDSVPNTADDENHTEESTQTKKQHKQIGDSSAKRTKKTQEKKIKIVKYSVQPKLPESADSSETETDYSSTEETDSTSGSEVYVVKPSYKHRSVIQKDSRFKPQSKFKIGAIKKLPAPKLPLRVKISAKKTQKSAGTITPVSMNRSVGTLAAPFSRKDKSLTSHSSHRVLTPSVVNWNGSSSGEENKTLDPISKYDKSANDYEKVKVVPNYSEDLNVTSFGDFGSGGLIKEFTEADLKVSQSLPSEILDTSGIHEEETVSDSNENEKGDANKLENMDLQESEMNSQQSKENLPENEVNLQDNNVPEISDEAINKKDEVPKTCEEIKDKSSEVKASQPHACVNERANSEPSVIETNSRSQSPIVMFHRNEVLSDSVRDCGLQIIHRSSSPNTDMRGRAQLGELFIDKYSNKKSLCIRCYTCRKMMSVDLFLRHLHDVSGGFIPVEDLRIIDIDESDVDEQGLKIWENFQRKKELFDNNQVPSPDVFAESVLCSVNSDSNHSCPEKTIQEDKVKSAGPLIITTPVSPVKPFQNSRQATTSGSFRKTGQHSFIDNSEGTRASSRKRKKKQLYPCEEYSFSKFPRLQGGNEKASNV